jgi:hypothetical protein
MRRFGSRLIPTEIAPCLGSQDRESRVDDRRMIDRIQPEPSKDNGRDCLALWSERIDYGVHSSPRAFDGAVRNVLRRNRRAPRHVSCSANGPSRNAGGANGECEND